MLLGGVNWVWVFVFWLSVLGMVSLDVDVYAALGGGSDSWLFMGDLIMVMMF